LFAFRVDDADTLHSVQVESPIVLIVSSAVSTASYFHQLAFIIR